MLTRKSDEAGFNRVTVRLLGEEYNIRGRDAAEYLSGVAESVEDRLSRLQADYPKLAKTQLAVLLALQLEDELQKLRRENEEIRRHAEAEPK